MSQEAYNPGISYFWPKWVNNDCRGHPSGRDCQNPVYFEVILLFPGSRVRMQALRKGLLPVCSSFHRFGHFWRRTSEAVAPRGQGGPGVLARAGRPGPRDRGDLRGWTPRSRHSRGMSRA